MKVKFPEDRCRYITRMELPILDLSNLKGAGGMMHFRINHRNRVALPVWRGISISPWRLSRIVAPIRPTTNRLLTVTRVNGLIFSFS